MKKSEGVDIFFCWGGKTHKKNSFLLRLNAIGCIKGCTSSKFLKFR